MKILLLVLSGVFLSFTIVTDNPVDRLGVKGPLKFNGTDFNLTWTDKPRETYYIQEYLPEGENLKTYNQMMTLHFFDIEIKAEDAVGQKVRELTERKKTDAVCNYQVTESPDGKEFMVDFLLSESKDGKMTTVEFNVYHYRQIEYAKKKKGIAVYAYTKRSYGDDITGFLKTLKQARMNHLNEMISTPKPTIVLEKK